MPQIEAKGITKSYDNNQILKGIDLSVESGEAFVIIGPTGAGKTTLLHILDLLDKPSGGQLNLMGTEITGSANQQLKFRRRMAFVQQKPVAFNTSFQENIAYPLKWRGMSKTAIKARVQSMLELIDMTAYAGRNALNLSGGETQRLAIARALVTEPEVIFLDEPTANMDPVSTAKIEEVLAHIINQRKTTIVMTTHDMSQGQRMATRLGVLINGELLQTGSVYDIFNQPQNTNVAEFVGVDNILRGVVAEKDKELARIAVNGEKITAISSLSVGETVYVLIRPEIIVFSLSGEAGSARNVFRCRVEKINTIGSQVRIEVNCGFPLMGVITNQAAQDLNISIGKEVYASFKATAIHVIKRPQ